MVNYQQNIIKQIRKSLTERQLLLIQILKLNILLVNSLHAVLELFDQLL